MFKKAEGLGYLRFLRKLHASFVFDWYMEIGCRDGRAFAPVRGKTLAVDPFFLAERNVINDKPVLHVFQQTSDAFFASGFLRANKIRLSVSFLDGMHRIEYLLRDFINTEKASDPAGVILMHDTVPHTPMMATRFFEDISDGSKAWTGDVWKILPILQRYRPDLTVQMLDCKPTGLLMVTGLNPKSTVLPRKYAEICAEYQEVTLQDFGVESFANSFEFVVAQDVVNAGFAMFEGVRLGREDQPERQWMSP
jgi:hypothetical protein